MLLRFSIEYLKKHLHKIQDRLKLNLVDLSVSLSIPSIYDEIRNTDRPHIRFIQSFIKDLSTPIRHNGAEHIDYIPTQLITEYLRYNYTMNNKPLDGILYNSAVHKGKSIVLFVDNDSCVDSEKKDILNNELYLIMRSYEKERIKNKI